MYQYHKVKLEGVSSEGKVPPGEHIIAVKSGKYLLLQAVKEKDSREIFERITKADIDIVKKWFIEIKKSKKTEEERNFLKIIEEAIEKINYEYSISVIEPSIKNGKIEFVPGIKVATELKPVEWIDKAIEYCPNSSVATVWELMMFYALRIAKRYCSIEYMTIDSRSMGNYRNSPATYNGLQNSASRTCAGYRDGIGNTRKICLCDENRECAVVGGDFKSDGKRITAANVEWVSIYREVDNCSAVVVYH